MSEDLSALPTADEGQVADDSPGVTEAAPQEAAPPEQAQASGVEDSDPGATETETFFDPAAIKDDPNLMAAYKQMQAAYTKKTQEIAELKNKAGVYDQIVSNPHQNLAQIAEKLGYTLTPAQQAAAAQQQQEDWEPQSWEDVLAQAEQRAEARLMQKLQPILGQVHEMRKKTIEQQLDSKFPDWRQYEEPMARLLGEHPTLAKNPDLLYRLGVPPEVHEARATQRAVNRMKEKSRSAQVSKTSDTHRKPTDAPP